MSAGDPCRFLEWDSAHFGRRIGRVEGSRLTPDLLASIRSWTDRNRIDCLYLLADCADEATRTLAEASGFKLVDLRVTFAHDLRSIPDDDGTRVRRYEAADLPKLCAIARASHAGTRFYRDGGFPREKCDELYEIWIRKSCGGEAKAVFVGAAAEGYATCHLDDGREGSIGLVAVGPEARGKGLGRALVSSALRWFRDQQAAGVSVVAQGDNEGARRLYESCGFRLRSTQAWYHGWGGRS